MNQTTQSHVPSLQHALFTAIDAVLCGIHTVLPAVVDRYDYTTQTAEIKPALKRKFADGTEVDMPVIAGVPVVWPGSENGGLTFPLNRGDTVLLVFSERSMDEWMSKGGVVSPSDGRKFDLSDAVAIPRIVPGSARGSADNNTDMVLKFQSTIIRIKSDGECRVEGGTGSNIIVKANGDIELGTALAQKLLTASFESIIFNNHIHPVSGAVTGIPTPIPDVLNLTKTTRVKAT